MKPTNNKLYLYKKGIMVPTGANYCAARNRMNCMKC